MQVAWRLSDADKIIARMRHLDLVMRNGQSHGILVATDFFFQNYLGEVSA